jgi:hypothetical protein
MTDDIRWFVRIGIDQGLFTLPQARQVLVAVGDGADLMTFAQGLIDAALVQDVEALEQAAGLALANAAKGPPPVDPFAAAPALRPAPTRSAPATANAPTANAPGGFAFETLARLDDTALAEGMRSLLRTTMGSGASDLHLSTGARPFIRRNRALSFLSEHVLTAEEALRLNTVLLSAGQRKTFLDRKDYDYALALGADALPRQPDVPQERRRRRLPHGAGREPHAGEPRVREAPRDPQEDAVLPQRAHPHHRPRRLRQDDHPRLDGRLPQRDAHRPHHHRRGSHRGRPAGPGLQRHPARGRRRTRSRSPPPSRAPSARTPT